MRTRSRWKGSASAVLLAGLTAVAILPHHAAAEIPPNVVQAEVRQGSTTISIAGITHPPYGVARLNGQNLRIECLRAFGSPVGITYLLIPYPGTTFVFLRGTLPNGSRRFVFLSAGLGVLSRMSVSRVWRGNPCGAGGFKPAPSALGYVMVF